MPCAKRAGIVPNNPTSLYYMSFIFSHYANIVFVNNLFHIIPAIYYPELFTAEGAENAEGVNFESQI